MSQNSSPTGVQDIDEDRPSIDNPPITKDAPPSKVYHPFSPSVLALLMPASILGVLARLGLQALATYDGRSIYPLAYVQAVGCLVMGFGLALKEPFGRLLVPFGLFL
jgi:fluoride exporter